MTAALAGATGDETMIYFLMPQACAQCSAQEQNRRVQPERNPAVLDATPGARTWLLSPQQASQPGKKFLHFLIVQRLCLTALNGPHKAAAIRNHAAHSFADGCVAVAAGIHSITLSPTGLVTYFWYIPRHKLEANHNTSLVVDQIGGLFLANCRKTL